MRVSDGEICFVKERVPHRHSRMKFVWIEEQRAAAVRMPIARLELAGEDNVQIWVPRARANATAKRGINVAQQRPGILVDPQIDRNIEPAATDFAKAIDAFNSLAAPILGILREIVVGPDLIGDREIPRRCRIPGAADQRDVVVRKGGAQLLQRRQADQEIAAMVELQHQDAPA